MNAISLKSVTKNFPFKNKESKKLGTTSKYVTAVNDISFEVEYGEFVGYLGPNGAGKSTTLRMIAGILSPSFGSVHVCGLDPVRDRAKNSKNIGTIFGHKSQLWWELPVLDSLVFLKDIYKVTQKQFRFLLEELDAVLEIGESLTKKVKSLSLGQRMRVEIAASLIHSPEILVLDEPTIGLDIVAKKKLRTHLKKLNTELGKTIILTTHDVADIEELCPRIILINSGKVIVDGAQEDVKKLGLNKTIAFVEFTKPFVNQFPDGVTRFTEVSANSVEIELVGTGWTIGDIYRLVDGCGIIADIQIQTTKLEYLLVDFYQKSSSLL